MAKKATPGSPRFLPQVLPPKLPRATWDAIRAVTDSFLTSTANEGGGTPPGFVDIARACRAARDEGRIPSCSKRQLDAALRYLDDAGELLIARELPGPSSTPGSRAAPAQPTNTPLTIHVNRFLDVTYDEKARRARVFVGGKPFLHCAFIVASIDKTSPDDEGIGSIDDLAVSMEHDAHILEGPRVREYLSPAEEVLAHASNLQAWAEHGYDTRLLHTNIAFPLLKELAKAGDDVAARALDAEIESRLKDGNNATRKFILETYGEMIHDPALLLSLIHEESCPAVYIHQTSHLPLLMDALKILADRARRGDGQSHELLDEEIELSIHNGGTRYRNHIIHTCLDLVRPEQWLALASNPDHEFREIVAHFAPLAPPLLTRLETTTRALLEQAPLGSRENHECKAILDMVDLRRLRNCLNRIPTILINGWHREVLNRNGGGVQDGVLDLTIELDPNTREDVEVEYDWAARVDMSGNEDLVRALVIDYVRDYPPLYLTRFDSLARLTNLEVLIVNNCRLARLPDMSGCLKLRKVDVSNNSLTNIEQLAGVTNLVELDASQNEIRSICGIENLRHLVNADFSNNRLLPATLEDIERLLARNRGDGTRGKN